MNKLSKVIVAILGGVNTIFNIALPLLLGLLIVVTFKLSQFSQFSLILICILATAYRTMRAWF